MATEKQISYINDLIARHVAILDSCIASWDRWQAEVGPNTDTQDLIALYQQARPVFAAMALQPETDNSTISVLIGMLKRDTGGVLMDLVAKPGRAAALGIAVDAPLFKRIWKIGVYSR